VDGTVEMSAAAADADGIASVDFYANGYLIGRDTTAPYSIGWDTKRAPDSDVPVKAVLTDGRGAIATSSPVAVKIRNH